MKDSEAELEEWWEVAEEYFTKELEKNLAHHRANEKNLKYKLEVIKRIFQISFVAIQQAQKYRVRMKRQK